MKKQDIQLHQNWLFCRSIGHSGNDYVCERWDDLLVTDVLCLNGKFYLVHVNMTDRYSFDIGDDHGARRQSTNIWAFPVENWQVSKEDAVADLVKSYTESHCTTLSLKAVPPAELRGNEKAFRDYVLDQLRPTLEAMARQ